MIDYQRLKDLRNAALRYLYERGASETKGYVPVHDLYSHLGATNDEWKALRNLFINEGIVQTDGMNAHFYLTPSGRSEAERLT